MILTTEFNPLRDVLRTMSQHYHDDILKLSARPEAVILTTDDREARWAMQLPAVVEEAGDVCIPLRRFLAHFLPFNGGDIKLASAPESLALTHGMVSGMIQTSDLSVFPDARKFDVAHKVRKTTIQMPSLITAVKAAMSSVSDGVQDSWTKGLYFDIKENDGCLLSTDRKQCSRVAFKCAGDPMKFTLDAVHMRRVSSMEGEEITFEADDRRVRIKNDNFLSDLMTFAENPPDIGAQFAKSARETPHTVQLPTEFLLQALSLANSVGGQRMNFFCYLDLGPDQCFLRADGDRRDEIKVDLRCQAPDPMKVFFNHIALAKSLPIFTNLELFGTTIELKYTDGRNPLFFPFTKDCESLYLTMPLAPPGTKAEKEEKKANAVHAGTV